MNGKHWSCEYVTNLKKITSLDESNNHNMHFSHWILHKKQWLQNPKINLNLKNYFCYIQMKEEGIPD